MDSISLPIPAGASHPEFVNLEKTAECVSRRNWVGLFLPAVALVLWLLVGSSLSWLIKDFNRSIAPETSIFSPELIFSLYLVFAIVIGRYSWKSWRKAASR